MGIYADRLISEVQRQWDAEDLLTVDPESKPILYIAQTLFPEQIDSVLLIAEEMLTDIKDNVPPIRDMSFRTVVVRPIHSDRQIALLQWSPRPQSKPFLSPYYSPDKGGDHSGFSIQVDPREPSVRILRPTSIKGGRFTTEGSPHRIEDFLTDPILIIPDLAGALLNTLAIGERRRVVHY